MKIFYLRVLCLLSTLISASPISDEEDSTILQFQVRKQGAGTEHHLTTITPKPHATPVTITQQGQVVTTYIPESTVCDKRKRCKIEYTEKVYDWYSTVFSGPLGHHTITDGSQTITFYTSQKYGGMTSRYCSTRGACAIAETIVNVPSPTIIRYPQITEVYYISPYQDYQKYLNKVLKSQHGHTINRFVFPFTSYQCIGQLCVYHAAQWVVQTHVTREVAQVPHIIQHPVKSNGVFTYNDSEGIHVTITIHNAPTTVSITSVKKTTKTRTVTITRTSTDSM